MDCARRDVEKIIKQEGYEDIREEEVPYESSEYYNLPETKQKLLSAASGWATGFMCMKVGKFMAFTICGGVIVLQVAKTNGYMNFSWMKVLDTLDVFANNVQRKTNRESNWIKEIISFTNTHTSFTCGLVGGLLVAIFI